MEHAEHVQGHVLEVDLFDLEHAQDLAGRAVPKGTGEHALIAQQDFILGPRHAQEASLPDHAAVKCAVAVEAAQERCNLCQPSLLTPLSIPPSIRNSENACGERTPLITR